MIRKTAAMADDLYNDNEDFDKTRERIHREMLSAVSHDLKTPLATIIGSLEIFTRMHGKLSAEKKETLIQSALSEAYRLDNFITNILDMAKLEGGGVKIKSERCNLTMLLQDALTRLGPKREKGEIELNATTPSTIVHTDPMLLSRAIGLLLDNGLKHAGKYPTITIEYGEKDKQGFIHVQDNGPGIPAGKEQEIFSKYARLSRSDQQNAGTGLGLAICRHIMNLLSGTVQTSAHKNGGAIFTLRFPSQPE